MSKAIVAEEVSKQYRLRGYGYKTVRDTVADAGAAVLGLAVPRLRPKPRPRREIWALRDVSFEIEEGDLVGIIGRNGAGKTTILKIVSRITKPTSGWAEVRGRVGSLLEVGTGFHPELTGRENVYLRGAILGMTKREIGLRFDEIVAFSEVGEFLDMPIKRYSSGMQVRLAFAVAAHFEPEILIVDEVLAVGDAAFQKKCLGKMGEVTREGRTVVFVSHNMAIIHALCRRGILLDHGSVAADGPIDDVASTYLRRLEESASVDLLERPDRSGWGQTKLERLEILGDDGGAGALSAGRPARFVFHLTALHAGMTCELGIYNQLGHPVTTLSSALPGPADRRDPTIGERFECTIDELPLVPGRYRIDVTLKARGLLQDRLEAAAFFDVEQGVLAGRPVSGLDGHGNVVIIHRWHVPVASGEATGNGG
jgi:lipopolysaccharide transport system ATP-binding protein